CLREIASRIGAHDAKARQNLVTRSINELREGSGDDFYAWLTGRHRTEVRADGVEAVFGLGFGIAAMGLRGYVTGLWSATEPVAGLGKALVSFLPTGSRLSEADPVASYDAVSGHPTETLHALYADPLVEGRFSSAFRRAFGTDVVVDRMAGSQLP